MLVPINSKVTGIGDLGGKKVCADAGTTSIQQIQAQPSHPIPVAADNWTDCLVMLEQGQVAAISTDNSVLAGLEAQDPQTRLVGPQFTVEQHGIAISKSAPDLVRFVNAVMEQNGRGMDQPVQAMVRNPAGTGPGAADARLPQLMTAVAPAPPAGASASRRASLTGGKTTPARLRLLLAVTIAASLPWGAAAAWTASQRTSAAGNVVTTTEPLSYDAQQIYQSLSDADATQAAAFLALSEPGAGRSRYLGDIARAETYLEAATAAAGNQGPGSELTVLSTEIPVYTGLVETARADNQQGLAVGAAFQGEASHLMRTTLLPAADLLYQQENARLATADQQATGLPILAVIVALAAGYVLFRAQRWVSRRTHRYSTTAWWRPRQSASSRWPGC